jgi:type IV pilus assembly protein PilM
MSFINNILSSLHQEGSAGAENSVVGIDIGSSSMKVVELQDRKGVITLTTYGEIQLGPYAGKKIGESVSLDQKKEQQALVDIIRESAVKAREAVLATPLAVSFVTNVIIEADLDDDLSSMVRVEARKVIPASLSEVTLDWAEVDVSKKESGTSHRNVLIAAIQNSALERFKVLMLFAGLKQPPIEIECFSTIRGLYDKDEPNVAIIDIGAASCKLYITSKGLLARMYRIRAGGAIATKNIAKELKISFEEAEELKIAADSDQSNFPELKRTHDSSYDRAFREFNQVMREYEKKTGNSITSVYMVGGGSLFPNIDMRFKEIVNREVIIADPFIKVAYPAFMEDTISQIGPSFAVALGAAMRTFN